MPTQKESAIKRPRQAGYCGQITQHLLSAEAGKQLLPDETNKPTDLREGPLRKRIFN